MPVTSLTIIRGSCPTGRMIHCVRNYLAGQKNEDTEVTYPNGLIDPFSRMPLHSGSTVYAHLFLQGKCNPLPLIKKDKKKYCGLKIGKIQLSHHQ